MYGRNEMPWSEPPREPHEPELRHEPELPCEPELPLSGLLIAPTRPAWATEDTQPLMDLATPQRCRVCGAKLARRVPDPICWTCAPQAVVADAEPAAPAGQHPEYREVWDGTIPPGGWVCDVPMPGMPDGHCGHPVESEPCPDHGPGSAGRLDGDNDA